MTILVTGASGFIGFHLCKYLLNRKIDIVGIDNFNSYYDTSLKRARAEELYKISRKENLSFKILEDDIADNVAIDKLFKNFKPRKVVNLAAQAGVRYSIENPSAYIQSNIVGFGNILEACRHNKIEHLIYASSSSVYGGNTKIPFSEKQGVDHPVSLYAASKKTNELMAHTYSHLYSLPCTGLRFFTVYGPWGRPDMALFLFTKAIIEGNPINVFNNGDMIRDFTYIDDIVESLFRLLNKKPTADLSFKTDNPSPESSWAPYRIFNIGNSCPTPLNNYIKTIENELGIKAKRVSLPMQQGDVRVTSADCKELSDWIGFKPNTSINDGIRKFINWYKKYYSL